MQPSLERALRHRELLGYETVTARRVRVLALATMRALQHRELLKA